MRKYLRNITVGAALLLLAGSCTDKFEEYNTNQYQIHDADPATLMKSMIETIVNIQQNDSQMQDQMVGQLGGYLCCSNTWSGTNFSTFNQSDAWNATPWNTPFEKIYGNEKWFCGNKTNFIPTKPLFIPHIHENRTPNTT